MRRFLPRMFDYPSGRSTVTKNGRYCCFLTKMRGPPRHCYPWARVSGRPPFHRKSGRGPFSNALQRYGYGHWILRFRYWRFTIAGFLFFRLGFLQTHWRCFLAGRCRYCRRVFFTRILIGKYRRHLTSLKTMGSGPPIYDYRLSLSLGKPLVFFTQTLGPFIQPKYKEAFQDIFYESFRNTPQGQTVLFPSYWYWYSRGTYPFGKRCSFCTSGSFG